MKIKEFLEKADDTRKYLKYSKREMSLREMLMETHEVWSYAACTGYCIYAMQNVGFNTITIRRALESIAKAYQYISLEDAEEIERDWRDSSKEMGETGKENCEPLDARTVNEAFEHAVAKAYPYKIIKIRDNSWACPICKKLHNIDEPKPKYCSECGQRLIENEDEIVGVLSVYKRTMENA